jgi:class 3 adenylate cyclase/tetratricopeptide (TPR) repeat protein
MPVCSVCGQENPEVARFCLACGAALSAEPRREERKVVTVLFADLVGFTSRAEQLDPEDVRAVLAPYWERLRGELERRGGTVEKFIGDAVMALFGAPVAHEDDPLRAVGAALAIRDWARDEADVQVRIAVNTGEALVLLGARPGEGEGMAAGDVVNTAARLQSAAPVNGVLVGETTYRATRDVIEYREHEPVMAKGKAEPIPVWEAVQVRSRLGMDVEQATSPLVGRTRELGVIVDAFARARAEREPQLVNLVGVPGIGKSRLVSELFAHLEQQPELVRWRQGRALPYGDGVSFWALAEIVKAQVGLDENEDEDTAVEKLRASVAAVVEDDEQSWVLDHLRPLVGADRAHAGGGESAPAWRRYFEGLAEQSPLVLVFEDMHWADDGLLDFIDHLVEWATGVPLLVIATARPELLDRRPAWGGGKLNVSTVALTPLSDEEAARIIHGVLERSALPVETQRALVERAGGNPLYAEQFARLYLERGTAEDLPLPETVQGLIAARLDGLPPQEKRVIQDAAVFGKVFWAGALGADEGSLHSLERKGMVRRERRSSVAGETQYAFRHVLVRDVAYGLIPRAARGDNHLRAAAWIESLGRSDDHAELLAYHLGEAVRFGAEVADRACAAYRRAGERSQALGAWPAAARYFAQAIDLWPAGADGHATLVGAHAWAHARATGEVDLLAPALEALEAAGLREEAARLGAQAALAVWYRGKAHEAEALIARAKQLLDGLPDTPALAAVLAESARLATFAGRLEDAERDADGAAELAERFGLDELRASVLVTRGTASFIAGELDEARDRLGAAAALAPPGSTPLFRALANLATIESSYGDLEAWKVRHAAALDAAQRAGDRQNILWLESQRIGYLVDFGAWDEALRLVDELYGPAAAYHDATVSLVKAAILASRGVLDEARALRDAVLGRVGDSDEDQSVIPLKLGSAWVAHLVGDDEHARRLVAETWSVVEGTHYRAPGVGAKETVLVMAAGFADRWRERHRRNAPTLRIQASLLMLGGDPVGAAEAWAHVSPYDEAIARLDAARALGAQGRRAEAELQLQRGLSFFRAVGATRVVEQAEGLSASAAAAE